MPFAVFTGSEDFAAETQKQAAKHGSRLIPVYYSSVVDERFMAIFDGDKRVTKPIPIREGWGAEVRKEADKLGWTPVARPAVKPSPPAKVEKPAKGKPTKAIAKVEPALTAPTLAEVTTEIIGLQKRTVHNYIEIGKWLHEAKRLVGHGNWLEYLKNEVRLSEWVAQACMRMSKEFGSNPGHVEDLTFSEVVAILNAPVEARPALIELAKTASVGVVREAVREANRPVELEIVETRRGQPRRDPAQMPEPEPTEPLKILPVVPPTPPQEAAETKVVNGRTIVIYGERPEAQKHAIEQFVGAIKEQFEVSPTSLLEEKSEEIPAKPVAPRKAKPEPVNAEAKKFNANIARLLKVATELLPTFAGANGSVEGGGNSFGLNQVYALQDALVAIQQQLERVVEECNRGKGD